MNAKNDNITFRGEKVTVLGKALRVDDRLPDFRLVGTDLKELGKSAFAGKVLVISVVPSIDTPVCSIQTKRFSEELSHLAEDAALLTVSLDLPFAQKRWAESEKCTTGRMASDFKHRTFGEQFGVYMKDLGLFARSVFVADPDGKLALVEYVREVTNEPDYDTVLEKVRELV